LNISIKEPPPNISRDLHKKCVAMKNVKLRLFFVYTIPCGNTHMAIGHLSTHVPSVMFNDVDGGKRGSP